MSPPIRCRITDLIPDLVPLPGTRVVDVGCGDGTLVRALTRLGADVTGIECNETVLARARAAEPIARERYLGGVGQALPLPDTAVDLVTFVNSLHHIPVSEQSRSLAEARRVLVPGGHVLVNEPLAEGPYFELLRPLEDETEVRRAAQAAVRGAASSGLEAVAERIYLSPIRYDDYESFARRMIAIDPRRQARLSDNETNLRAAFKALARRHDGAWHFDQPCRIDLLRKATP